MDLQNQEVIYSTIPERYKELEAALRPAVVRVWPSRREAEVLFLLVRYKLSNKQIARIMEIDETTVKTHLHRIFEKFGVEDRVELIGTILEWEGWYVKYDRRWRFLSPVWARRRDPAPFMPIDKDERPPEGSLADLLTL